MGTERVQLPWVEVAEGQEPLVATAIHHGHDLRPEVAELMALGDMDRLREEDPYTGVWTTVASTRIVVHRSRFEMDLNRPPDRAVYRTPEDAWGLQVWKEPPPADLAARSLAQHHASYGEVRRILSEMESRCGRFVVLDLHSYNHRRAGAAGLAADPRENPEVNVGTGTLDRPRWGRLVDGFIDELSGHAFLGRSLDVRENVKFQGGYLARWIHENFPDAACCLAIEFKKFFMDEWTGEIRTEEFEAIARALRSTVPSMLAALQKAI